MRPPHDPDRCRSAADTLYSLEYSELWLKTRPMRRAKTMRIRSEKLTTCSVGSDGTSVGLEFLDSSGATVAVEFPLDQAEAIVMTLPHLLARALVRCTGNDDARYVFDLEEWSVERAKDQNCLIATLKTRNGFEVCFGIPSEACQSLGSALRRGVDDAVEVSVVGEEAVVPSRDRLN